MTLNEMIESWAADPDWVRIIQNRVALVSECKQAWNSPIQLPYRTRNRFADIVARYWSTDYAFDYRGKCSGSQAAQMIKIILLTEDAHGKIS